MRLIKQLRFQFRLHSAGSTTHLPLLGVLVDDPLIQRAPPVLNEEGFRVLLALPIPEAALSLRPRNEVVPHEVHFQVFPDLAADLCLRAPGSPVLLLPDPAGKKNLL